jgi:hypothetical protein
MRFRCDDDFPSRGQLRLYLGDGYCHGGLDHLSRLDGLVFGRLVIDVKERAWTTRSASEGFFCYGKS